MKYLHIYKQPLKILAKVLLGIALFIGAERFSYIKTGGFSYGKIATGRLDDPTYATPLPQPEERRALETLFDQPFYFLGNGNQCYAFISEDGKSVLKFFKLHYARSAHIRYAFHTEDQERSFLQKVFDIRKQRISSIFSSCQIAFEHLREETGIRYLHLAKTTFWNKSCTIVDKIGNRYQIDLDKTMYILQKRADLIYPHLQQLMQEREIEKAKACVDSILTFIRQRCAKGIADTDPRIEANFGFVDGQAIVIDLGAFREDNRLKHTTAAKKELFYETLVFKSWLGKNFPELEEHLEARLAAHIEKLE